MLSAQVSRTAVFAAIFFAAAMACLPAAVASLSAQGETSTRSVWDGVYTAAQAARGEAEFELYCIECHGPDLEGLYGPTLVGPLFLRNWLEDNVNSLFARVHTTMPADAPGLLSAQTSADITSYLLQANEFPPGSEEELTPDPAILSVIQIQDKDRPGLVPNFSLVLVVGCLEQRSDGEWMVVNGTEPVRTRGSVPDSGAAGPTASARPLGVLTFYLMDAAYARPELLKGQTVAVRGLLIREPGEPRLNVTSIQSLGSSCGQ